MRILAAKLTAHPLHIFMPQNKDDDSHNTKSQSERTMTTLKTLFLVASVYSSNADAALVGRKPIGVGDRNRSATKPRGPRGQSLEARDLQETEEIWTDNNLLNGAYGDPKALSEVLRMGMGGGGGSTSMGMGTNDMGMGMEGSGMGSSKSDKGDKGDKGKLDCFK